MTASTSFSFQPPRWWRPAWLLGHLLAAMVMAAWVAILWMHEAWLTLGWVPPAAAAWLLSIGWRPLPRGELRWDGQRWFLAVPLPADAQECEGSLSLAIDAGDWMLLRFLRSGAARAGAGSVWLLLGQDGSAHEWMALRRAVYSPRPEPAGPSAQATAHLPA